MLACFGKHFLRCFFGKKPFRLIKKNFFKYCMNEQEGALKEEVFAILVLESDITLRWPFIDLIRERRLTWILVTLHVLFL